MRTKVRLKDAQLAQPLPDAGGIISDPIDLTNYEQDPISHDYSDRPLEPSRDSEC